MWFLGQHATWLALCRKPAQTIAPPSVTPVCAEHMQLAATLGCAVRNFLLRMRSRGCRPGDGCGDISASYLHHPKMTRQYTWRWYAALNGLHSAACFLAARVVACPKQPVKVSHACPESSSVTRNAVLTITNPVWPRPSGGRKPPPQLVFHWLPPLVP